MKKTILLIAALGALSLPASASADIVCAGTASVGACAEADAGCVVGSLKGYQYLRPCVSVEVYREIGP